MYLYGPANKDCCSCIGKTFCRLVHVCLFCGGSVAKRLECWTCNVEVLSWPLAEFSRGRAVACFSKAPVTFRARKAVLCLNCLYCKVSIILRIIRWNYQLRKQNWLVRQEVCYCSTGLDLKICLRARKVIRPFEKRAPGERESKRAGHDGKGKDRRKAPFPIVPPPRTFYFSIIGHLLAHLP